MGPARFDELRLAGNLPSPSALGLRILEVTATGDYDQERLVDLIRSDPALTGRILKIANGAAHGQPVASVHAASMRLGAAAVRNVALGFTLMESKSLRGSAFDLNRFWSRSLATAVSAHLLASARGLDPVPFFTLGLLTNIGQLALASIHAERYNRILTDPRACSWDGLIALENREFELDQIEAGACMMRDWGLVEEFSQSLLCLAGRLPEADPGHDLARMWAEVLELAIPMGRVLAPDLLDPALSRGSALRELWEKCQEGDSAQVNLVETLHEAEAAWRSWSEVTGVPCSAKPLGDLALLLVKADLEQAAPVPLVAPSPLESLDEGLESADWDEQECPDRSPRILVLDRDPAMLQRYQAMFRGGDYELITSTDLKDGLGLALDLLPHVIALDWDLEGASSAQFIQSLRRSSVGRRVHILVTTARYTEALALRALRSGADDVLSKDMGDDLVLEHVNVAYRSARERSRIESAERASFRNAAEMSLLGRRLRAVAMSDPLTGMPNRRFGMQQLKREWERAKRDSSGLAVALIDIDHFKAINDQGGHDLGDAVLREVADTLSEESRAGDVLARVGGEEFLVVLPRADLLTAGAVAERLRIAVEALPPVHLSEDRTLSISVGVAVLEPTMSRVDDLLKAADLALYDAKESGRNRVVLARGRGEGLQRRAGA